MEDLAEILAGVIEEEVFREHGEEDMIHCFLLFLCHVILSAFKYLS